MPEDPPVNENDSPPDEETPDEPSTEHVPGNGEETPAQTPVDDDPPEVPHESEAVDDPAEVVDGVPDAAPHTAASSFAQDDGEAAARYDLWNAKDPFNKVPPALLNSGDIADYVAACGMIFPFHAETDRDKLKPASYEVDLLGRCISFTGPSREDIQITEVGEDDEFVLRRNEIAFVQLEPFFRLPRYIALRFNLRIKHVYRGLLLGTGPLVDPGFIGRLWIPLHNLTANDYVFRGGEGLVWMEFTKLSRIFAPDERGNRQKFFTDFPDEKIERNTIEDYLNYADPYRPIRSSIPELFGATRDEAQHARDEAANAATSATAAAGAAQATRDRARNWGIGAGIGVALALLAIVIATWTLVNAVRDRAEDAFRKADRLEVQLENLREDAQSQRGGKKADPSPSPTQGD
jgi:deoxycytidine triphosphate deaminase